MNDDGLVVGTCEIEAGTARQAFTFDGSTVVDLPPLDGDVSTEARVVARDGVVLGRSIAASGRGRAVAWLAGHPVELPVAGGAQAVPTVVNDAGQVVGVAYTGQGDSRVVVWHNLAPIDVAPGVARHPERLLLAAGDQRLRHGGRQRRARRRLDAVRGQGVHTPPVALAG